MRDAEDEWAQAEAAYDTAKDEGAMFVPTEDPEFMKAVDAIRVDTPPL